MKFKNIFNKEKVGYESLKINYDYSPPLETKYYVTILDRFIHHFTKDKMVHIRVETVGIINNSIPIVSYETISEKELYKNYPRT